MPTPRLWPWLWRVALDWAVIVIAMFAADYFRHPAVWFACIIVIGTRQHALGLLGHDGAHRLACRNRKLNDTLTSLLCLWPLGIPIGGYRRFHFEHHRTVGTQGDPELIHKNRYRDWDTPFSARRLVRDIAFDFLGGSIRHLGMAMYLTRATGIRDGVGPVLFMLLAAAVCLMFNGWWILVLWFLSMGTAFWASFRLRLWTEHVGTDSTHRITANWFWRFICLPHNTWCHWEHHEHPMVPCWALPTMRPNGVPTMTVTGLFRELETHRFRSA